MSKRLNMVAMVVAVGMVGVACSSDGEKAGDKDEPKLSAAFCDAAVDLNASFNDAPQGEDPKEMQAYYDSTMEPLVASLITEAPADLSDELATLQAALEDFVATGDFSKLEEGPVTTAEDTYDEQLLANCSGEKMNVSAVEYAFEGVPDTVKAGRTWVRFSNDGGELHEMALMRKNDGVTETFQELLELPEEEAQQKVTFVGGGFATQGEWDGIPIELTAGEYALLCFVPVGSVDPEEEVEGPPHFTKGMIKEFKAA